MAARRAAAGGWPRRRWPTGDPAVARAHLDRFPFEPVGAGDDPAGLVARLDRVTGLVLLAEGAREEGMAHLAAAEERWERLLDAVRPEAAAGEELLSVMIDLGRPPVAGLSDPARELARVRDDRARAAAAGCRGGPPLMPRFRESIVCEAPPAAVWRLVHDPERIAEWMADTERVEPGEDGTVVRYLHGWPDFPMPTRVESRAEGARVVISCLVSDIDFRVSLAPDAAGCAVEIEVTIPEAEASSRAGDASPGRGVAGAPGRPDGGAGHAARLTSVG